MNLLFCLARALYIATMSYCSCKLSRSKSNQLIIYIDGAACPRLPGCQESGNASRQSTSTHCICSLVLLFHRHCADLCHSGFVNTDLANGWLTGTDALPAAVQQVTRPLVRALCPWILVAPSRAVQTVLHAATAPSAEVRYTLKQSPQGGVTAVHA